MYQVHIKLSLCFFRPAAFKQLQLDRCDFNGFISPDVNRKAIDACAVAQDLNSIIFMRSDLLTGLFSNISTGFLNQEERNEKKSGTRYLVFKHLQIIMHAKVNVTIDYVNPRQATRTFGETIAVQNTDSTISRYL